MESNKLNPSTFSNAMCDTFQNGIKSASANEENGGLLRDPTLALQNVDYRVKYRSGPWWRGACFRHQHVKHVLHDVELSLPAGQLIGLVGSSGSGKTSLLDVIAFRTSGDVTGKMTYRGVTCTKRMMRQRVSYVIQADRLLPNLTVRETLTFTAYLKLPDSVHKRNVEEKVNTVINRMGLKGVAESRVGGAVVRGVSGGEKRRVTIALQLLKDPDILLLDEPTTGLDSFTARHLVGSLQGLARQGKLVVLSLHQPRSDIVKMLDQTALMCQGHVMFFGQTSGMVSYFTKLGHPCPTYANPLDHYMDIVSIDRRNAERQEVTSERARVLLEAYTSSELLQQTKAKVAEEVMTRSFLADAERKDKSPSWGRTFSTIVGRMNLNLWRDKQAFINRFILCPLFVPFILVFLGRLKHNQSSLQDRMGILYQALQVPAYIGVMNNVALFPTLRDHFYREGLDGLYKCQTFLIAYTVHVFPFVLVSSTVFATSLYWIAGFYPDAGRFGWFVLVCVCMQLCGELIATAFMGIFRDPQLSNTTVSLIFTTSTILSSGFLKNIQAMPEWLQSLCWVTIHKYASEILVVGEFHDLKLSCNETLQGLPCLRNGDDFIDSNYPGAVDHMERNVIVMVSMMLSYFLLALLSFKALGLKIMQ